MIPAKPLNLFDLPSELLEHIFLFMPFHVLLYFSHTCRKLREIIKDRPSFQKNLKHLKIIYQTGILHCTDDYYFLEDFPKTVIDEGFDHTISLAVRKRFNQIKEICVIHPRWTSRFPTLIKFCESLERLELWELDYYKEIKDISFLEKLVKLKYLHLDRCTQFDGDISPLEKLVNLKELHLGSSYRIRDISPLKKLIKLECLHLVYCDQIRDISPLEKLVNLQRLYLFDSSQIQDISPLEKLVNLEKLDLRYCTKLSQDHINDLKLKLSECHIRF